MQLFVFGLSHQSAPLALRERLAFPGDALRDGLHQLRTHLGEAAPEQALISTCNRTELVLAAQDAPAARELALSWLAEQAHLPLSQFDAHLYHHTDEAAIRHLFRVACGLESMVLGEPQILGQLKQAAREAQSVGSLGSHLHQLFQQAFSVAKDVRSQTAIGEQSVSMAAAGVRLSQQIFGDLSQTNMLFVGAGEMIQLCLAHFAAHRPRRLVVANRTLARAATAAEPFGGEPMALARLPDELASFDIVVSCTASTLPVIGLGMVERALKKRRHRPIFFADLAVPRDIEPEVKHLSDAFLYTVDDFSGLVQQGAMARQQAVGAAEQIIDRGVQAFQHWTGARQQVGLIRSLQQFSSEVQAQELAQAQRRLSRGESPDQVMRALAQSISQKLLHGAYVQLNDPSPSVRAASAEQIRQIFRLSADPPQSGETQ